MCLRNPILIPNLQIYQKTVKKTEKKNKKQKNIIDVRKNKKNSKTTKKHFKIWQKPIICTTTTILSYACELYISSCISCCI